MAWRPTKTFFYRSYGCADACRPNAASARLRVQITSVRPALPASTLRTREVTALEVESHIKIRVESELHLKARESRSRGSGASLGVPESSTPAKTLLPGA